MNDAQIELHRTIRTNIARNRVERTELHYDLTATRGQLDKVVAALPEEHRQVIRRYLDYERQCFPLYLPAPNWLREIADHLQVVKGDSPGADEYANAVHAIRLITKRSIANERKLVAIKKIIGDLK